ncbi:hypothetical protein pEaSNUABM9_00276 [Erwinia phage pEa_SNUABM_9]|nr:hypothetical protein pEaSNUABM9_00276 [Erwinia phage pEa_SNUABM_9]
MKRKPFAVRLFEYFFPDEVKPKIPRIREYRGSEDEFWEHMEKNHRGWTPVYPIEENKARVVHYHDEDGNLVAVCVRWPQRNYYYTVTVY